ncbi:MAG TPA: peptide-methionine (S)-S-oxide reductase MsrA [Vicinamibacterales bacterium]|nr:peptide-methionine (S)-S-oxide reductase MsrA [Vicinamibacterales bacterium]
MATIPLPAQDLAPNAQPNPSTIVLGGGCFWCVEAVYLPVDGVLKVRSGYAGDAEGTANYEAVCSGATNQAEVVEVTFDPARVSLGRILQLFFGVAHDPTQLNRQGHDRGRQYRSAIFYNSPGEREFAERYIAELNAAKAFAQPIVTTLEPLDAFYEAEPYHQNYAARNPAQPYILFTALPKVEKLKDSFPELLKK